MQIIIRPQDDHLTRWGNQIAALGDGQARAAIARAVNRTTRSAHGKVIRATAKMMSLPIKRVQKSVYMKLAAHQGTGPIQGIIGATGAPLSLKYFGAKQFSWGVRAKVFGQFERFPHAFIWAGTPNSGKAVGSGHVFKRIGSRSLPIERLFGPSIPAALIEGEAAYQFTSTAESMLPARITHELGRLLGQ